MIINRADRDLSAENYCKQIKKMAQLKNQRGFLFGEEEQDFLNYLVGNNRIKLFKNCLKKDKDKPFEPTEFEKDILPSIKKSDFVKSRHILNIVSESAKIAIRDYIDNLTMRTNDKVELIACDITQKVLRKFTEAGKQITALLEIKQEVMNLAEDVRSQNGQNILTIIKAELPECDLKDFEEDFQSIMFFKGIYDKTETYFSNLINKTYAELTQVLNKMDAKIVRLQK